MIPIKNICSALWNISDNWWNTDRCLKPTAFNKTGEYFSEDTRKRIFNTTSTLNSNLESWNEWNFNGTYALKEELFNNNSQFTELCHTLKSLSTVGIKNFTDIGANSSSSFILGECGGLFDQLQRSCANVTTVTPAEEYWECVNSIDIFCFGLIVFTVLMYCYRRRVLMLSSGIEDIGGMQWELLFLLGLSWILIYVILGKGLSQSGKVVKHFWENPKNITYVKKFLSLRSSDSVVHSNVSIFNNGIAVDQSRDIGRCWRRYQISDHSTMGKFNEFRYLDRRNNTNFFRLQCRRRYFTGSWVIQSVSSQLLQVTLLLLIAVWDVLHDYFAGMQF